MNAESDCIRTLAIDGPAASGKSVVGKKVARRLGCRFLDTGAMYRAITWASLEREIALTSTCDLSALASGAELRLLAAADEDRLFLDGEDITDRLRLPEVDARVSAVSAVSGVRKALVEQQRTIAAFGSIVMCGRDIGTVVLPDATVKVFLTASPEVRAARRAAELDAAGHTGLERTLEDLLMRDRIDSERDDSPLRPADDALVICSDDMSIDDVVSEIVSMVPQC